MAILALDVVGYSRLMREDDEGTLADLAACRTQIDAAIAAQDGRIFNTAGDSVLAEFASPVAAVRAAIEIQTRNAERTTGQDAQRCMQLRIGLHLGDVMVSQGDLFGDGVNVAARLETLSQPGGFCLSGALFEQVRDRLDLDVRDIGPQTLKNISRPVAALLWGGAPLTPTETAENAPDWLSIAVLPFENMSGDPSQTFLADGISEEIITTLSKIPDLMVVSRHSTFSYKGQTIDTRQIGREQGATHVLEGSLRAAGNRVRVSAQLVDTQSGHHLWAERYDRELDDIFDLQDEIALRIATALHGEMIEGDMARLRGAGTRSLKAWEHHVKANFTMRGVSRDKNHEARALVEKALQSDPNYAAAHSTLALTHAMDARHGFSDDREASIAFARESAKRALELDPQNTEAHAVLGFADMLDHDLPASIEKHRTALRYNPSHAEVCMRLALALVFNGQPEEAVHIAKKGMTLCPSHPPWYAGLYGFALRANGQLAESIPYFREYGTRVPGFGHVDLVIVYVTMGDMEMARAEAAKLLEHRPDFTISNWAKTQLYSDPALGHGDLDALRKAGLPE